MKKVLLLLCIFACIATVADAQIFHKKRKDVDGVQGVLTLHPDLVMSTGLNKKRYYFFFDIDNKYLFVTDNDILYKTFSEFLPAEKIEEKEIQIEGVSINPFTLFSKKEFRSQGKKLGLKLNKYKICKIFNYSLIKKEASATDPWRG